MKYSYFLRFFSLHHIHVKRRTENCPDPGVKSQALQFNPTRVTVEALTAQQNAALRRRFCFIIENLPLRLPLPSPPTRYRGPSFQVDLNQQLFFFHPISEARGLFRLLCIFTTGAAPPPHLGAGPLARRASARSPRNLWRLMKNAVRSAMRKRDPGFMSYIHIRSFLFSWTRGRS